MLLVLYKCTQPSYITGVVIDVVHLWNLVLTWLSLCTDMVTEGQRQKSTGDREEIKRDKKKTSLLEVFVSHSQVRTG